MKPERDKYAGPDDPLDIFMRRVPPEEHAAARENLRWFVNFARRLAARLEVEGADARLDNVRKVGHGEDEKS